MSAEHLFEHDIDVVGPSDLVPRRPPSPSPGASDPARKRRKKKTSVVYSDEDEDEHADRTTGDRDGDFVIAHSPPQPQRRAGKKGTRPRGRPPKDKGGGISEITVKDERKLAASAADAKTGTKRRRETISEAGTEALVADGAALMFQSSSTASGATQAQSQAQEEQPAVQPPPAKVRKLPTIKKNKPLVSSAAPSAAPSTPSASAAAKTGGAGTGAGAAAGASTTAAAAALPIHVSLPRKPIAPKPNTDIDLFNPDNYASLFKGGSTPRAGINPRVKEEERRKELMKMRDEARAARMAELQKTSFDLLAGQDKVGRFEAKLRLRNSPALFPNRLGSAINYIVQKRSTD